MSIDLIKSDGDNRGQIIFFKSQNLRLNLFEIKKDSARGGHFHNYPVTYILLSGKIEHRKKFLKTNLEEIDLNLGHNHVGDHGVDFIS